MSDYISRADAKKAVYFLGKRPQINEIWDCLDALPSADAVGEKENDGFNTCNNNNNNANADNKPHGMSDLISRADAICEVLVNDGIDNIVDRIKALPSADAVYGEWTPCGEKMPKELERVNVTWLNHNPPFYYQHIKDIPQTDTAVYYRGKWYWWDATVIDILAEYGEDSNAEQIDKDIEFVAWMPLPTPYKGGDLE